MDERVIGRDRIAGKRMETSTQPNSTNVSTIADLGQLVAALRALLVDSGSLPSERLLAERLSVKRHQLRRALEILRTEGQLQPAQPRRGEPGVARGEALIRSTNPIEVIELRLALEPALARLAALRATPLDIVRIERAATTPAGVERGAADLSFHKAVAMATGNTLAADFYALLRRVGSDARLHIKRRDPECPNRVMQRDREHRAIADAIAARDPDGAETAMREHLVSVQAQILGRMAPSLSA